MVTLGKKMLIKYVDWMDCLQNQPLLQKTQETASVHEEEWMEGTTRLAYWTRQITKSYE